MRKLRDDHDEHVRGHSLKCVRLQRCHRLCESVDSPVEAGSLSSGSSSLERGECLDAQGQVRHATSSKACDKRNRLDGESVSGDDAWLLALVQCRLEISSAQGDLLRAEIGVGARLCELWTPSSCTLHAWLLRHSLC